MSLIVDAHTDDEDLMGMVSSAPDLSRTGPAVGKTVCLYENADINEDSAAACRRLTID